MNYAWLLRYGYPKNAFTLAILIGALISLIQFHQAHLISASKEQHHQKILRILVKCLDNVVQEIWLLRKVQVAG